MKKSARLSSKFIVLLLVFTVIALFTTGVMTYISQTEIYKKQCEDSIRNIGEYLKYMMEAECEDTAFYQDYFIHHYKEMDIPTDFSNYWDAKLKFNRLFEKHHPGKTLGEDIAISEMDSAVQKAYFEYEHEYWLITFEKARDAFNVPYTYFATPTGHNEDVMYILDAIREPQKKNPEYLELGITVDYKRSEHKNLWAAWDSGKIRNGYDVFSNKFGHTYAYYVPVVIDNKTIGVIGTEIEVERVNKGILLNTLKQLSMISVFMVFFTLLLTLLINERIIKKIVRLAAVMEDFKNNKSSDVAEVLISDAIGSDELATLADETASMMYEIESYIHSLDSTTRELQDTRREIEEISETAKTDALTGVGNKLAYDLETEKLEDELKSGHSRFGISMIDLNYLKKLNDTHGHEKGNLAIKKLARLICEVFPNSRVYRIGGDEFAVIMRGPDIGNIKILVHVFNQRLEVDKSPDPWDHISAAIGYALYDPKQDKLIADTFKRADDAMYQRKKEMKALRQE